MPKLPDLPRRPAPSGTRTPGDDSTLQDETAGADQPDEGATLLDAEARPVEDPAATALMPGRDHAVGVPAARLVVLAGPKAGVEFALGPGDTSIGRQSENVISIPDISVSRRHVVVRQDRGGFALVDLGSGNGTLLNGERLEGEARLASGDVFAMGDTEVRFELAAGARRGPTGARLAPRLSGSRPVQGTRSLTGRVERDDALAPMELEPPAPQQGAGRQRRRRLIITLAAFSFLMFALGLVKHRRDVEQASQVDQQREEEIAEIRQAMDEAYEQGKKELAARNFKAAIPPLQEAARLAGEIGDEPKGIVERLELARGEIKNQELFDRARAMVDGGQLAAAFEALAAVPETSAVRDMVDELRVLARQKVAPERLTAARTALAAGGLETARAALADVLAVDPENPEAQKLAKEVEAAGLPKPGPSRPRAGDGEEPRVDPTSRAVELFRAGKVDEALAAAAACGDPRCRALANRLASFRDAWRNLDAEGNTEKALGLYAAIAGGAQTPFLAQLGGRAASGMVRDGLRAMSAENLPRALELFRKALSVDPGNQTAEKNLRVIRQKAKEVFDQAYVDKTQDPEKARRGFEAVLTLTAPEDELHAKARKHLKALGGGD